MKIEELHFNDSKFPANLREISDCPESFYFCGNKEVFTGKRIAIVGTRRSTPRGETFAFELARDLSRAGICIVSGLAYGIDAAAHRGALEGHGSTIAVLANGLPEIRPAANRSLAEKIITSGGLLLSELETGAIVFKSSYLVRNRLISGLCDGVVVVEAGMRSGAINTANHALYQNRDVMAVPGRPGDSASAGTNALIQRGAQLVTSAKDVADFVGFELQNVQKAELSGVNKVIVEALLDEPMSLGELGEMFGKNIGELYKSVTELELMGFIKMVGARYVATQVVSN